MPLPDDDKSEPISPHQSPDALDDLLREVETRDVYHSTLSDTEHENGSASRRTISQAELIELLQEPEFQAAVTKLQEMSVDEAASLTKTSPTIEIGFQIGRYKLLELIGFGGMGQVYRAVHVELNKTVAVKLLPPDRAENAIAIDRFRHEMKALGQFSHPHVVLATDAGEEDERFYLVMEYVEGFDLSELVEQLEPLPVANVAELIRQAALGVQAIHRQGLIHRDIKPSNIMLSLEGIVKVLDLELSRFNPDHVDAKDLTAAGQVLGTKRYMAPEQFETSQVDSRADLYSLGATLGSLLFGKVPLTESTGTHSSPERDDIPEEFLNIIRRCTARISSDRLDNAGELIDSLQPFCVGNDLQSLLTRAANPTMDSATGKDARSQELCQSAKHKNRSIKLWIWALLFIALIIS